MNKQWIYRNGDKPFSVTEIVMTDGEVCYVSVTDNEGIFIHQPDGKIMIRSCSVYDLIPYEPYVDYVIDDEVYFRTSIYQDLLRGHFAGLNNQGQPTVFDSGQTSFTSKGGTTPVDFCDKAEPKEDK
jgi:hypothetical protein